MKQIDLNCDLGESYGAYRIGDDAAMLQIVSSANIACGFHGGDPLVMHDSMALARDGGVGIGAHPGFDDLWGFGRRRINQPAHEVEKLLIYQIGAAQAMAKAVGAPLRHYKIHGALANMACEDPDLAMAAARAVQAVAPELIFVVMPGTELERAGTRLGLSLAREIFADRAYGDDAGLIARDQPGAMIHDPEVAATRILEFLRDGAIISQSGQRIPVPIDTICVHGDSPGAVAMAQRLRQVLDAAGYRIAPMQGRRGDAPTPAT